MQVCSLSFFFCACGGLYTPKSANHRAVHLALRRRSCTDSLLPLGPERRCVRDWKALCSVAFCHSHCFMWPCIHHIFSALAPPWTCWMRMSTVQEWQKVKRKKATETTQQSNTQVWARWYFKVCDTATTPPWHRVHITDSLLKFIIAWRIHACPPTSSEEMRKANIYI